MPRIIDLDKIAPVGVTVRKSGIDYQLPGDPPTVMWLGIIEAHDQWAAAEGADSNEALALYHDRMLALFQIEQPDLRALPFGPSAMFAVLAGYYGSEIDEAEDPPGADEADSTTKTTNGRPTSPKTKTATGRSRSSR